MSFSKMLEILQEKNKKSVVLIKLGVFYVATGKDAVFFNKELGLKCVCFKNQVCKITIDGAVFYGGTECIVNEMKDDKVTDFEIVGVGLSK